MDWPVLALLAVALASTAAAQNLNVALREFYTVFLDGALFYFLITRLAGRNPTPNLPSCASPVRRGEPALPLPAQGRGPGG